MSVCSKALFSTPLTSSWAALTSGPLFTTLLIISLYLLSSTSSFFCGPHLSFGRRFTRNLCNETQIQKRKQL